MSEPAEPQAIVARIVQALEQGDEREALEAARAGYDLYNQGGIEAWIELFDEDVEWSEGAFGVSHGREAVIRQQREFIDAWDEVRLTPESVQGDGTRMVVRLAFWARGKGSGAEVEGQVAHLWEVRDGLVRRLGTYLDSAEALAAAGL